MTVDTCYQGPTYGATSVEGNVDTVRPGFACVAEAWFNLTPASEDGGFRYRQNFESLFMQKAA